MEMALACFISNSTNIFSYIYLSGIAATPNPRVDLWVSSSKSIDQHQEPYYGLVLRLTVWILSM